jgi:hypothetical protein
MFSLYPGFEPKGKTVLETAAAPAAVPHTSHPWEQPDWLELTSTRKKSRSHEHSAGN